MTTPRSLQRAVQAFYYFWEKYFSFEAVRNSEVWDLRYIWGGMERRHLGPSIYCTVQYLYIALNIHVRFASWAVFLRIECLHGTFDVRHHQDISNSYTMPTTFLSSITHKVIVVRPEGVARRSNGYYWVCNWRYKFGRYGIICLYHAIPYWHWHL